jgi:hypothetical protein
VWPDCLWYYEDYPYVETEATYGVCWATTCASGAELFDVSERGMQAKFAAIWAFRSQLSTFFGGREEMEARVGGYCEAAGGRGCGFRSSAHPSQTR